MISGADDRDGVALGVVVRPGRRQLHEDEGRPLALRDADDDVHEDLSARFSTEERVFDLAAPQGGDRALATDPRSYAGDIEAQGGRLGDEAGGGSRGLDVDGRPRRLGC